MLSKVKSLFDIKVISSFSIVALTGLVSFGSTKVAFDKFQDQGIIALGDALNVIGIIMILSSLSIESGLVRKFSILKKDNETFFKSALILLYFIGAGLGLSYVVFGIKVFSEYIILVVILYFPFSVLRSYLISIGQQLTSSMLMLFAASSTLVGVVYSSSASQIFNAIIFFWFIFIFVALVIALCVFCRSISPIQLVRHAFGRSDFSDNLSTSIDLLRFSFHSIASGFQNNQAMLASRVFLVTFVNIEYAAQMEMYQRPLTWIFILASSMVSLFFYPFVVKKMNTGFLHTFNSKIPVEIFTYTMSFGLIFIIALTICFPFLFWLTFGYGESISPTLAAFWIGVFSLRFFGVLFSAWLLAKDDVMASMIGEAILYLPLILAFQIIPSFHTFGVDAVSVYLPVVGFSSLSYVLYFIFALKLHSVYANN